MNSAELQALKELCELKGWVFEPEALYERVGRVIHEHNAVPLLSRELAEVRFTIRSFIKAREALPKLIAEVETLQTLCRNYKKENERLQKENADLKASKPDLQDLIDEADANFVEASKKLGW